jgi:type IV secretory pathway VirB10-like protein
MSGLLTAPRPGPLARPGMRRFLRSWQLKLIGFGIVLFVFLYFAIPGEQALTPRPIVQPSMPNATYDPPVTPAVVRAPDAGPTVTGEKKADVQPEVESYPRITLELRSFGGNRSYVPEYLKPQQLAAEASTKRESDRIAYHNAKFPTIQSWTDPDRTYKLSAFSTIPCLMETAVITGAAGITPFRCHVHTLDGRGVRSPADVVLFEENTVVGGFYKSTVAEGDSRVVMVTARAETPFGVKVQFGDMPVADNQGAAGVPGSVDNKWGQRIGGALLLAMADAGVQTAQTLLQNMGHGHDNNAQFNFGGGGNVNLSGLSSVANAILSKTINIPPTISLHIGDPVMLWVTEDIDFSPSYRVGPR